MSSPEIRVIISGGGTGGHIFPAIAIADAIRQAEPGAKILFVGAEGRMEMEKVPAAGYEIKGLWISGLQRSFSLKNLLVPLKIIHSSLKARKIIQEFKPGAAVGVGGYASGPTISSAASMGIPTILQEQNSYPGITNKMLAAKAKKICVAYNGMEKYFPAEKIIITGNPVRKDITNKKDLRNEALSYFGLDGAKPVILAVGGSLGARTLNLSLQSGLKKLVDNNIQLIWQTGKSFSEIAGISVEPFEKAGIKQLPFISRMDLAYAAADIVISRAGAIAISELCITGKPSILVPSPNVAEDHQTKNAMALVSQEAAILVTDAEAPQKLVDTCIALTTDKPGMQKLSRNIAKLAQHESAQRIAGIILECIKTYKKA
ncbi:MAG: undecaprenyldiphospho-muramoylpentapeptide beta-N-acetylglucosaminyltransferase [Lentimicrobium sp.]|nr:undecaprenyldiphospho-muramoylpentapeptide beta-N-acetylglucosaminyltransferase [Lentimicrobium sp.]